MALSEFDKQLSQQDQNLITQYTEGYNKAAASGDTASMQGFHDAAEYVRNRNGYTGGSNGSGFGNIIKTDTGYTSPELAGIHQIDTSKINEWGKNTANATLANLESAYNSSLANLGTTYNMNRADLYGTAYDTAQAYQQNMKDLYNRTYLQNSQNLINMANRGLTSAAQGIAMNTSGLVSANQQASALQSERDTALSQIALQLDRLAADYNISRDELVKNLNLDKVEALSNAELQTIQMILSADQTNAGYANDYLMSAAEAQAKYNLQNFTQLWQSGENALDREQEKSILERQIEAESALSKQEHEQSMTASEKYLRLQAALGL